MNKKLALMLILELCPSQKPSCELYSCRTCNSALQYCSGNTNVFVLYRILQELSIFFYVVACGTDRFRVVSVPSLSSRGRGTNLVAYTASRVPHHTSCMVCIAFDARNSIGLRTGDPGGQVSKPRSNQSVVIC